MTTPNDKEREAFERYIRVHHPLWSLVKANHSLMTYATLPAEQAWKLWQFARVQSHPQHHTSNTVDFIVETHTTSTATIEKPQHHTSEVELKDDEVAPMTSRRTDKPTHHFTLGNGRICSVCGTDVFGCSAIKSLATNNQHADEIEATYSEVVKKVARAIKAREAEQLANIHPADARILDMLDDDSSYIELAQAALPALPGEEEACNHAIYIDGYKEGSQSHSWQATMFLFGAKPLPLNEKLSHKQLADAGFLDWLGKTAPKLDYYILRDYAVLPTRPLPSEEDLARMLCKADGEDAAEKHAGTGLLMWECYLGQARALRQMMGA